MRNIKVGILGATGLVGQHLIEILEGHPCFKVEALFTRSEKKDMLYYDVVDWSCASRLDPEIAQIKMSSLTDWGAYKGLDLLFSALPSDIAFDIEGELRQRGHRVVSNASAYRMEEEVPLLVPEMNSSALELVELQKKKYNGGFIATNPNCCCIGIALALAPVEKTFGLESLHIVTMQARSGAGIKGLQSSEINANIIPNIEGEEVKIKTELPKIFSRKDLDIKVRVNRVPVIDGHTFNIWFKTKKKTSIKELIKSIKEFKPDCGELYSLSNLSLSNLNDAKQNNIYKVYEDNDFMPQPKIDSMFLKGMGTAIGRIEAVEQGDDIKTSSVEDKFNEFCMTAVSNNIVRGAAGGTLIIAELLKEKDMLK
jgi:aspartate-semialdehyde dehydrogenase